MADQRFTSFSCRPHCRKVFAKGWDIINTDLIQKTLNTLFNALFNKLLNITLFDSDSGYCPFSSGRSHTIKVGHINPTRRRQ